MKTLFSMKQALVMFLLDKLMQHMDYSCSSYSLPWYHCLLPCILHNSCILYSFLSHLYIPYFLPKHELHQQLCTIYPGAHYFKSTTTNIQNFLYTVNENMTICYDTFVVPNSKTNSLIVQTTVLLIIHTMVFIPSFTSLTHGHKFLRNSNRLCSLQHFFNKANRARFAK